MEFTPCNLCGADDAAPYATLPDLLLGRLEVQTQLVQCRRCQLVYQNPRPTLAEMGAHYPPEYESYAADPGGEAGNPWLSRVMQYGLNKRARYVTRHKRRGHLLDVGCAAGVFLRQMRASGHWQVTGVEVSEYPAQIARERYGLDVRLGTLEQAAFPTDTFDAITLWDVLEHLHDPVASLRELVRILKPDGILIVRVPNLRSWDAELFGESWAGLDAPRHLYLFTPDTVRAMLTAAGLQAIEWSGGIGAYPTFLLSLRFWDRLQPPNAWRSQLIQSLYHPFWRVLTGPVFWLSGLFLRGPLIVVTARKAGR